MKQAVLEYERQFGDIFPNSRIIQQVKSRHAPEVLRRLRAAIEVILGDLFKSKGGYADEAALAMSFSNGG